MKENPDFAEFIQFTATRNTSQINTNQLILHKFFKSLN